MQFIKKRPILCGFLIFIVLLLLSFLLFGQIILTAAGNLLLEEDTPVSADYIIVLQGSIPDRIVHGADLYHEDYADQIMMAQGRSFTNYELIAERGLDLPESVEINKTAARQLGVTEEDMVILPGKVGSTREEAEKIAGYLDEQYGAQELTLLLVTSRFHSNRAHMIFQETLNEKLGGRTNIVSTPSPYDTFEPDAWWKDRTQARNLLMEYLKLINYYTFDF